VQIVPQELVSQKLKEAREKLGLTQEQVAEALKRPLSYVSRCETGQQQMGILELEEYCKLYNTPITFFLSE